MRRPPLRKRLTAIKYPRNQFLQVLKSIQRQAEELKARARRRAGRHDERFRIGTEIEVCLLDGRARPVDAAPVIEALSAKHPCHNKPVT